MTDKLTDSEIVKGLECCVSEQYTCRDCPYQEIKHYSDDEGFEIMPNGKRYDDWSCERWLNVDLLDLINRLQSQNKDLSETVHNLTIEKDALFDKVEELKVEVERLKTNLNVELENFATEYDNKIKAEAIKEFAERLKDMSEHFWEEKENFVSEEQIDNLLKELVGDDNA